ncbi:hypothetical protein PCC7424_4680 [Gloeothece citriformis PCC 7424]|uniref:Uncharacterized protein n=1 Tax=Gloeothece citriformis (strain PCC 7424) TaxID=65393 RepID=B7KBR2_GLOC7|nr:hypothetical protein [Gloeothece citriformis]ACK73040.1 hypothetical protein PCC7424_4680 [Gloeothece citriformis PCC 7424]
MLNKLNLFSAATLSLVLSTFAVAPMEAKPVNDLSQDISPQIAQLDDDEAVYEVVYPVGIVRTIEGNIVSVQMMNGQVVAYEVTPTEMETWKLYTGSYVLVDENDNKILDTVYKGQIRSITGSVVTVELENGELQKYGADRRELGAMNLIEGQQLYVTRSQILALAPQPDIDREAYLMNTTPSTSIYQDNQAENTQQPREQAAEYNQPQQTQMNQMYQQPDTIDRQDTYQQTEEPVRGMW